MPPQAAPEHVKLRDCDRPFWQAITTARGNWNCFDLTQAAVMARAQADIERLQTEVDSEGDTVPAGNATAINPKIKLLELLARRVVSMAAKLHVHTLATTGRPEDAAKGNQLAKAAREQADDDLIPRLRAV